MNNFEISQILYNTLNADICTINVRIIIVTGVYHHRVWFILRKGWCMILRKGYLNKSLGMCVSGSSSEQNALIALSGSSFNWKTDLAKVITFENKPPNSPPAWRITRQICGWFLMARIALKTLSQAKEKQSFGVRVIVSSGNALDLSILGAVCMNLLYSSSVNSVYFLCFLWGRVLLQ